MQVVLRDTLYTTNESIRTPNMTGRSIVSAEFNKAHSTAVLHSRKVTDYSTRDVRDPGKSIWGSLPFQGTFDGAAAARGLRKLSADIIAGKVIAKLIRKIQRQGA